MSALIVVLVVTILIGVPIGACLMLASMTSYLTHATVLVNEAYVYKNMVDGLNSYPLLAVPLFVFSGLIMAKGGIARKLFEFFAYFMGRFTAGLPITAVVTCLFYGALSGSGPATTAAVGSMVVPYMMDLGYEKNFSVALVATAGGLGVIIPPSIPFIVYALAANVSVGDMFIAGILPGFVIAIALSAAAYAYCKKHGEEKELLRKNFERLHEHSFWKLFRDSFWALLTPVIILGGIYGGIVTPTEAATIAVFYSLLVSLFIYRTIRFRELPALLAETGRNLAPMLVVVAAAVVFGRVVTLLKFPALVTGFVMDTISSKAVILLIINIILLIAGTIVNTTSAILILTPVLLPIANAIGMNPVHFGIMMVVNLAVGFVTPPVGNNLFVACAMFDIPIMTLARNAFPFIVAFLVALVFVICLPQLSLILL